MPPETTPAKRSTTIATTEVMDAPPPPSAGTTKWGGSTAGGGGAGLAVVHAHAVGPLKEPLHQRAERLLRERHVSPHGDSRRLSRPPPQHGLRVLGVTGATGLRGKFKYPYQRMGDGADGQVDTMGKTMEPRAQTSSNFSTMKMLVTLKTWKKMQGKEVKR